MCELGAETGKCFGLFDRWYFNKKTFKCTKFIYGGCGGNVNNFLTEAECINKCAYIFD